MKAFTDLRIIFMGTPEFAVASLAALVEAGANIVAVITAPDKPGGRGMQLQQSDVKKYALSQNILVLQPEKLKNENFIVSLKELKADLQVVVAFRMLPEIVWNMPPMGTINLHGSLLPKYRGAAPIHWAVINGEKETGVTTFKLQHAIDTGDILLQESFPIAEDDNTGIVHDKMKDLGAKVLLATVKGLAEGTIAEKPQEDILDSGEVTVTHAPKLQKDSCNIDWTEPCSSIYNFIRGLSPFPTAYTSLEGKQLKIFAATKEETAHDKEAGTVILENKSTLKFACSDGFIIPNMVQLEGKKRMAVEDFLRGWKTI